MKLDFFDHKLEQSVAESAKEFLIIKGIVHRIGNLNESTTYYTTKKDNLGEPDVLQKFLGGAKKTSTTTTSTSYTTTSTSYCIPLIKIGNQTFSNVSIDSPSIFYALKVGNEVGCIFDIKKSKLHFVIDYTDEIEAGVIPITWESFFKLAFLILLVLTFLLAILALTKGHGILLLFLSMALLYRNRYYYLLEIRNKSNWNSAVKSLTQNDEYLFKFD